jgi:DNA-binding beta-propeller fold protein YncE
MTAAISPDGRYLAVVNAGYGTFESRYQQSIAVLDIQTGKVTDYPEARTAPGLPQMLYSGLAFGKDGKHLYAVFDSLTAPAGNAAEAQGNDKIETGNAVAVYSFVEGAVKAQKLLPIPLQRLAPGKIQNKIGAVVPAGMAIPSPAGIAALSGPAGSDQLLVADNLSDDVLLLDGASGKVIWRFDLSQGNVVPSTYPVAVTVNRAGSRAFVALWNGSAVAELDLSNGKVLKKLALLPPRETTLPSSHPAAFAWSPDEKTLYVALANRDAVAAVHVAGGECRLQAFYDTRLPGQTYFGAMPDAVAVSRDGKRLFAGKHRLGCGRRLCHRRPANIRKGDPRGRLVTDRMVSHRAGGCRHYALRGYRKGCGYGTERYAPAADTGPGVLQPQLHLHRHAAPRIAGGYRPDQDR